MARNNNTIEATINIGADISAFQSNIKVIQNELNRLNLSSGMRDDFNNIFKNLDTEIKNIQQKTSGGKLLAVDEKSVAKSFEKIGQLWTSMTNKISSNKVSGKWLEEDQKAFDNLTALAKQYSQTIKKTDSDVMKLSRALTTEEKEQKKINKSLEEQRSIQKELSERLAGKDDVKTLNEKLEAQKQFVASLKEEKREAEKTLKNFQKETPEQYRERFKSEHGTARGWNSAYAKEEKAAIEGVTQATQKLNVARQEEANLKKQLSTTNTETENLQRTTNRIDQLEKRASEAQEKIKLLKEDLNTAKATAFQEVVNQLQKMKDIDWNKYGIDPSTITSYDELSKVIEKIREKGGPEAEQTINKITVAMNTAQAANNGAQASFNATSKSLDQLTERGKEIDSLRSRITYFFSIGNAVRLFKRAIRSATETVKDLDKVMTETAVVTEFSVGDMWKSLPEYTKRANELGVSIHDVYEASTLYYQQGLQTNEVMAVTNATLRMARIAGLEAAEATDRITNALRGFNMEITEANADNIADVYSKLAAISASDVDEISTAMTKVASLASSANMSFENTAAFLSQIIETTRESAETAGTALKTVVARFSEVKDLYSEGELLGTDEEGEEINVNKVSKALRTAGINLNEFLVGQKGLDEIFMELASKWDDLDIVQQRYIATMAAGSRQQSRFIALMSDYQRTQELTAAAQNASGAAIEQYNKTLESLETKLTKLKNAWNEFIMSIANSDLIKGTVDLLTNLVGALNKITDAISGGNGILKSISAIAIAVGGLKLGKGIFNAFFGNPQSGGQTIIGQLLTNIKGQSNAFSTAGAQAGASFNKGFSGAITGSKGIKNTLKSTFSKTMTAGELGLQSIDFNQVNLDLNGQLENNPAFNRSLASAMRQANISGLSEEKQAAWKDFANDVEAGNRSLKDVQAEANKSGIAIKMSGQDAQTAGIKFQDSGAKARQMGVAFMGAGAAAMGLATIIEKITGTSTPLTKGLRAAGAALMAFGAILPIVSKAGWTFSTEMTAAIDSIPIIGWIAAVVSALIGLGVALSEAIDTPAEAAEKAREALENATETANEAKEAVNNLSSSYNDIVDNANKLEDLTRGTQKWKEAVQENNKAVLDLLQNYKELNIESQNGILVITNYDEVMSEYATKAKNLELNTIGQSVTSIKADFDESLDEVRKRLRLGSGTLRKESEGKNMLDLTDSDYVFKSINNEQYRDIATKVSSGIFTTAEQVNDYLEKLAPAADRYYKVTEEGMWRLRTLGEQYDKMNQQLDAQFAAMAATTLEYTNLNEEQQKYADSLASSGETIKQTFNDFRSQLTHNWYSNEDSEIQELYRQYVKETYGLKASQNIGVRGNFKDENGEFIRYKDIKDAFTTWVTTTSLFKDQLEASAKYLAQLSQSTEKGQKAFAKSYEGLQGDQLTSADLQDLKEELGEDFINSFEQFQITDLDDENSPLYQILHDYYEGNEKLQKAFGGEEGFKSWAETFVTNVFSARDTFEKAYSTFNNRAFKEATENFESGTIAALTKQLADYRPTDHGEFGAYIIDQLSSIIGDKSKIENVMGAFSKVALNSEEDLRKFKDTLEAMGINVATEDFNNFINNITEGMQVLANIDVEKIKESLSDLSNIVNDIRTGEQNRNFSKDVYDKLTEAGVDVSQFTLKNDGSYLYLGTKLDNIVTAINEQTTDLLGRGRVQLEAKEQAWNLTQDLSATREVRDNFDRVLGTKVITKDLTNKEWLNAVIQNYDAAGLNIGNLGIDGLFTNLLPAQINSLADATVDAWVAQIKEIAANNTYWKEQISNFEETAEATELMSNTLETLVSSLGDEVDPKEVLGGAADYVPDYVLKDAVDKSFGAKVKAILAKASEILPEDILEEYINLFNEGNFTQQTGAEINEIVKIYEQAKKDGLDLKSMEAYAKGLVEQQGKSLDVAAKMAYQNTKTNTATKKLIDTYKDWGKLFEENGPLGKGKDFELSSEQFKAFSEMKKALQDSLGLTTELSDEFFKLPENAKLLKTLMEGTVEEQKTALDQIAKNLLFDKPKILEITADIDPAVAGIEDFNNIINGLDEVIPVQALIDMPGFQASLRTMMRYGGEAGRATAQAIANAMHLVPKIKPTGKRVYAGFNIPKEAGLNVDSQGYIETFEISWEPANFTPPDFPTLGNAGTDKTSGSSSKPKQWKNPYDELYNKQQEINTALRERERLEHKYQDMLEDHTKTSEDLVKNNLAQIASLKRQIQLQSQLLKGRQRQLANVANETYEDSEGNRTTYAAMGVMRYVTYDEETREINIDWNELNKITDENLGSAIEAYVSRLEELLNAQTEIEDTIEELNDTVKEINERGREEYLDFEQSVYDAIVGEREAEIEALENVSQTIKDAADKTIQSVQDEINKERQLRENEKEEQSILDKQMRLAYLRRDTSGANALEIKKLEEELSNDTQSYQDKIIDQTLQQMQDDAAKAAEQREQQIDLLRQSLEIDKATGEIWNKVNEYIAGGIDKDGSLIKGSKLEKLLKDSADYTGMSRFGKENWDDDMAKKIAQAMMGVQSWELKEGKESGKLTLGDDNHTVLRYNPQKGTWYNTRTGENYTDDDLEYDYSKGKMVLKSKTSDQSQTSETPKSGPHKVVANGIPTEMYDVNDGHVAWTTAGGEQFDLVSEDGEDYIVANEQGARYRTRKKGWKKENGFVWNAYAQGGLVDTTGPAWLDGSKSRPEMVLDAADTRNLITLKNVLASILNNAKNSNANQIGGDNYFNIDIQAEIDSDYDVDQLADRIKKQIYDDASYRNVNVISTMR